MFQSFGFVERVLREAYWVNEVTFWKPDDSNRGEIMRNGRIQDVEDGLSEFPHVILNQARVHDFYLDVMRNSPARMEPYYSRRLADLRVSAGGAHPVTATFERAEGGGGDSRRCGRATWSDATARAAGRARRWAMR